MVLTFNKGLRVFWNNNIYKSPFILIFMATDGLVYRTYEKFEDIPEADFEINNLGRKCTYIINNILGSGLVNRNRSAEEYSMGDTIPGIILGIRDNMLYLSSRIQGSLHSGKYFSTLNDIEMIQPEGFRSLTLFPTILGEIIPYDLTNDDQSDLDSEFILPELRHEPKVV